MSSVSRHRAGVREEEEEGLFKADAVNEEDPERDQEEEEEEGESLFQADAVNEEEEERDRATQVGGAGRGGREEREWAVLEAYSCGSKLQHHHPLL